MKVITGSEVNESDILKDAIRPDGGIDVTSPSIFWLPGRAAALDGQFSAADLRAIANHMDANEHL
jgi:hypothetical protein